MCGIVGKYYLNNNVFRHDDLPDMMRAIAHRGPDDAGIYRNKGLELGFQRLSIIDVGGGHQPIFNEFDSIVLVCNGEIYNYLELRESMLEKGHRFRTKSDVEVIIHLYEEYGRQFVTMLNGMFAFCLYDISADRLIICRDRLGIKPFYIAVTNDVVVFGSEIKGIVASKNIETRKEKDVLDEYLCFRYLTNGRTFFEGVRSLEPATCAEVSPTGCNIWRYWNNEFNFSDLKENEFIRKIDSTLFSSVKRQLMSDVPVGTLLSGGVDSSLVTVISSKFLGGIKTFSIGFHEEGYDETPFSRYVADLINCEYHSKKIANMDFAEVLPKAVWFHDEPLNHANSIQIYLICKYARQYVKVLMTGEGADELFGGYPRYYICKIGERFNRHNPTIRRALIHLLRLFRNRQLDKLSSNLGLTDAELVLMNSAFASTKKVAWLFDKENICIENRQASLGKSWDNDLGVLDNLLKFEQRTYLHSILLRADKMSMAASIESRVPILDNDMIALANSIHARDNIKRCKLKYIFKKAASRHLPQTIIHRKKFGFGVPIGSWMLDGSGLGKYLSMILDKANAIDGINRTRLEKIIGEHRNRKANHEDVLWPLMNYAVWHQSFF